MSEHEKHAWASLIASALVWAFFTMRLTEGGWVADVSPRHVLWTYVVTVVLMIVSHSLIAALLAARRAGEVVKDERDAAIEARADRIEGYVLVVVINVLVVHALADAAFAGHALPRIDLGNLPVLVFALLSALFGGHIVKQSAIIWQYRA
jgi:uncharacterized membrane protein